MPLNDIDRIDRQIRTPRALTLWRTLNSLTCCSSFMNTGAHPDDETSAMLATLSYRDGMNVSYACANRGEGGQNTLGSQSVYDLGVIRTAEMERAADVLNLRLYWLNEFPDDSIFDFGFSKSGDETLAKWGHARTLKRFVDIIRMERPDIICPTFLDIPGQHGHHRAMTQLAHEVVDAAADDSYIQSTLPTWQVKKLYLPAWSGAGDAYDDDLPPPPATLVIDAKGEEAVSGWTFEQIGQQSRRFHKSQGMGRWVSPGSERDWSLHLAKTTLSGTDDSICAGLPTSMATLAAYADASEIHDLLKEADSAIQQALSAFPSLNDVSQHTSNALGLVRQARTACPTHAFGEVDHRLARKDAQLSTAIRLSSRVSAAARFSQNTVYAGNTVPVEVEINKGTVSMLEWALNLPDSWSYSDSKVQIGAQRSCESDYPTSYFPDEPRHPSLQIKIETHGITSTSHLALETTPIVMPEVSARVSPESVVINTSAGQTQFEVKVLDKYPNNGVVSLQLPEQWSYKNTPTGYSISVPDNTQAGTYNVGIVVDQQPASTINLFDFAHIDQRMRMHKAQVKVCVLDVVVPNVRVGYIGGGNDQVGEKLVAMGFDLQYIDDAQLNDPDGLKHIDTLVIGIFAYRTRPVLQTLNQKIHDWIHNGGNLLTLYHRPWDDWNEDTTPPKHLKIGKPSLRWRITDETATVTHLLAEHPLLNHPNTIVDADWQAWHKERGLYFAAEWDSAYEALLSMSDPGEAPHTGALLSANIGAGRHTHTSLILHHQMEQLVPGAFRIMANLVGGNLKAQCP